MELAGLLSRGRGLTPETSATFTVLLKRSEMIADWIKAAGLKTSLLWDVARTKDEEGHRRGRSGRNFSGVMSWAAWRCSGWTPPPVWEIKERPSSSPSSHWSRVPDDSASRSGVIKQRQNCLESRRPEGQEPPVLTLAPCAGAEAPAANQASPRPTTRGEIMTAQF